MNKLSVLFLFLFIVCAIGWFKSCDTAPCPVLKDSVLVYVNNSKDSVHEILPQPVSQHHDLDSIHHIIFRDTLHYYDTISSVANSEVCDSLIVFRDYQKEFGDSILEGRVDVTAIGYVTDFKIKWQHCIPPIYSYNFIQPPSVHFLAGVHESDRTLGFLGAFQSRRGDVYMVGYDTQKKIQGGVLFKIK